ncbi:MAG: tRNA uridine-5-carboxymethylaminomethyl(34) synthesis GTPase MnmE [Clostridia bacterium]|nr:tRNA uridine-5-carboxymethylaminomethyl(34) synthesis GTPase MnmE [Clostridia bacterium]
MNHSFDTVFAPSSAIGGAICVIRVSGDSTRGIAERILDRSVTDRPNVLRHVTIRNGETVVDDCMAVFFAAPKSYTGEDMLELHCHGGAETVRCVLATLSSAGGVPAEAGEFTRRAFLSGKMDLVEAEAVMDVINAQAESSLRAALEQLSGRVSARIRAIEEALLDARASIEAAIDYPDEAGEAAYAALPETLAAAARDLETLIEEGRKARVLRDGLKLVILGRPNVGKSSLLNALLGEDRAIVTATAGTTRDTLDERVNLGGVPVRLIDTAGVREASDEAERIGVDRAKKALETADAVLLVLDGSRPLTGADRALFRETEGRARIVLANKCDLGTVVGGALPISCKTGEGLDALKARIASLAEPARQSAAAITNERHLRALESALDAVRRAEEQTEPDCIATELSEALHDLGTVTGTDVDAELVDRIFANFCVGK